ncbi:MAG: DAK2 domain-containing protein [Firmicutes bacterium]|nr:DAK2 domain-containing protein [Candidatus Fiminaster equi]
MKTISAKVLKEMLISGANNLYNHYPEIDALNVFPVPDGDTGMNMNLTLASGAKEIQNRNDSDVYSIALTFSKGLLMGARGNSGVITSQIFRGFAQALEGKKTINADLLADAFSKGSEVAYKAVMRPVEGTILTVIRESSSALAGNVNEDIEKSMKYILSEAKASLKRTPDLLPVLKEVGVVDSGGAGLVKILEGMLSGLQGKFIEKKEISADAADASAQQAVESDEFGYCTEFILRLDPENKKPFIENRFKSVLQGHGNSLVVVHDDDIVKVHVHTLHPGAVLTYGQSFGEFVKIKVENMTEQHTALMEEKAQAEEAPAEEEKFEPQNDVGLVAVAAGKGVADAFSELGVNEIITGGQTMNPSINDIVAAIKKANAKTVFVFPNNSNIVMAALQAKDVLHDEVDVIVISTKTIPEGIAAVSQFSPDLSNDENVKNMKETISHIISGEITYAVKDTKMNGVEIKKNNYMAIMKKKIICCESKSDKALEKMLKKAITEDNYLATIFVGENVSDKILKELKEDLPETYPNIEFDIRRGDQPVYDYLVGIE